MPNETTYSVRRDAAAHTDQFLFSRLIPYIGNKRKLLPLIDAAIKGTGIERGVFVDLFAGSSVVARLAKLRGFRVFANDWEPYAAYINHCYIVCNRMPAFAALGGADAAITHLNALEPSTGYITTHLCPSDDAHADPNRERMFFTRANGQRIDAVREQIDVWQRSGALSTDEFAVLLGVMLYAVSYVSNTSGVFKAYHHGWGGRTGTALYRIFSRFELQAPVLFDNRLANRSFRMDAQLLAEQLAEEAPIDIAYLDPPYNQHPYGSNYHVLNTVALWDHPPVSPIINDGNKSAIRADWRTERRSAYNYAGAAAAYDRLLATLNARAILVSYSTDGIIPLNDLLEISAAHGRLACLMQPYKRYRVSTQRMSPRPHTIEFVLHIDSTRTSTSADIHAIRSEINAALLDTRTTG